MAEEAKEQVVDENDKKASGVSDFLVAPKKKRKNFVILAFGENFDGELAKSVEQHVRTQYSNLAVAVPKNANELDRYFGKAVSLLIIYDQFIKSPENTIKEVFAAKKKKGSGSIPTLFLTHDEKGLINLYHSTMSVFQEVDELLQLRNLQIPVLHMRIRAALRDTSKRRSRRFDLSMPVTYFDLNSGRTLNGRLEDASLHGCLLRADGDHVFRLGDQIRVNINASRVVKPSEGEFLKMSGRVRRVYISGDQAGISFEFVTERQTLILIDLLTVMMNQQLSVKRASIQIPKRIEDEVRKR